MLKVDREAETEHARVEKKRVDDLNSARNKKGADSSDLFSLHSDFMQLD